MSVVYTKSIKLP